MNATETEFSAKSRRKRFGSIKAKENASARALVPIREAFVISLIRPRILDINVSRESIIPLEKMFLSRVFLDFDIIIYTIPVLLILFNPVKIV
jgi:hypothetical protein